MVKPVTLLSVFAGRKVIGFSLTAIQTGIAGLGQ